MERRAKSSPRRRAMLHVELLEARVAPVIVNALTPLNFTDANGDVIGVTMTGVGQADVCDATGAGPNNSDIANIFFSGTNATSTLTIAITTAGLSNDVTAGQVTFLNLTKTLLGTMTFNAAGGTVRGTIVEDVNLSNLVVHAATLTNSYFGFGVKAVNAITLDVATVNGTTVSALGSVKTLGVGGNLAGSMIDIRQDISTTLQVLGAVTGGTGISVTRNANLIDLRSGMDNSSIYVGGVAKEVSIQGGLNPAMANGSSLKVGREAKEINITGNVNASEFHLNGKAGIIDIAGDVLNGSELNINGALKQITIHNSLTDSEVYTNSVTTFNVVGNVVGSVIDIYGNVGTFQVSSGSFGANSVGGDSHLWISGNAALISMYLGIVGDSATPVRTTVGVEGTVGTLMTSCGPVTNADISCGNTVKTISIHGMVSSSDWTVNGKTGTIDILGSVQNSRFDLNALVSTFAIHMGMLNTAIYATPVAKLSIAQNVIGSSIEIYGNSSSLLIGGNFGADAVGSNSSLWIAGNATLIDIDGSFLGDSATPAPSTLEVEGTMGTLLIGGPVEDSTLTCGANAKSIIIGDGAPGGDDLVNSTLTVREKATSIRIDGNVTGSSMITVDSLQSGTIVGDVTSSQIFVNGDAKLLSVTGTVSGAAGVVHVYGSATTIALGSIGLSETIEVRGDLKTLTVAGNIGAAAGVQPYLRAGSMGTATVGGLVYGNIDVFGTLGSILTGGANAVAGVPTTLPFTHGGGARQFMDAGGVPAPTGGIVQYMILTGIVS